MSWTMRNGNHPSCGWIPVISFGHQGERSAYDGESHKPHEVIKTLDDGHELLISQSGAYYSRRKIGVDKFGAAVFDEHGRREITRHQGESETDLIARWADGVRNGWF